MIGGGISATTLILGNETASELSQELIYETSNLAVSRLETTFTAIRKSLLLLKNFSQKGMLKFDDATVMNRFLIPFLTEFPQVSSFNVGDDQGNGFLILKVEDGWMNRFVTSENVGRRTFWIEWNDDGSKRAEYWKPLDYDPRNRPWYKIARQGRETETEPTVYWTQPYFFYTTGDLGITAAINSDRALGTVLAFDILLSDLSRVTRGLSAGKSGFVVLLTEEGSVVGVPKDTPFRDTEEIKRHLLRPVADLKIPPLTEAFHRWHASPHRAADAFQLKDGEWWAAFRPLALDQGSDPLYIGVLVPKRDFMHNVYRNQILILVISVLAIALAVLMAFLLARTYARPLERLAYASERIRNLQLEPVETVESGIREVTDLAEAHERMRYTLGSFAKYVPVDVVRQLLQRGEAAEVGGVHQQVTVLFTDIEGFTSVAEGMSAQALTRHMGDYFENLIALLTDGRATIDKLVGDAIIAFWNAPNELENHETHALETVLHCRDRLHALEQAWSQRGLPPLRTRFGLNSGPVVVGNVGSSKRLNYTVLGDTVNVASRLEGTNQIYGTAILVTDSVRRAVEIPIVWRRVDRVAVRGKREAIDIFEPLGYQDQLSAERVSFARDYEVALERLFHRDFGAARGLFQSLAERFPRDRSVSYMLACCELYLKEAPPADWDGTTSLPLK